MGYRSDVYLRFDASTVEVVAAVRQYDKVLDTMMEESCTPLSTTDFHWDSIKWYEGYKSVDSVMRLLQALDKHGSEFELYGFIRIGEDTGDVEHQGDPGRYNMYTYTQMEW